MVSIDEMNRIALRCTFPTAIRAFFDRFGFPLPSPTWPDELNDEELVELAEKLGEALVHAELG